MPNPDEYVPDVVFQSVAQNEVECAPQAEGQEDFADAKDYFHYFRFAFRIGTRTTRSRNARLTMSFMFSVSMHCFNGYWKAFGHGFNAYQSVVFISDPLRLLLCR